MNVEEYKEIGIYGLAVSGATKAIHWLVKKFESTEKKYEESQKHNRDITEKNNKERDERDEKSDDLYRGLTGVITDQNNKNARIIEILKDQGETLKDLLEHIKYKKS